MPWKERCRVDERRALLARLAAGERMVDLCREYGISRKTGYKFVERYRELGDTGLRDRSRAPRRVALRTTAAIEELVVATRKAHRTWGPRKLRAYLLAEHPGLRLPAPSTLGALLDRNGLIERRRRRTRAPWPCQQLTEATEANDVWCIDFKGQFRLGNGRYCYPLTITDQFSRYILCCEAFDRIDGRAVRSAMSRVFREYGLPLVIRSDNGAPFASTGLHGLSRLSVWWMRMGVRPERIEPGHPEQNGRHERMHLTLKRETTRPAGNNLLQQQERFDRFVACFNNERPHEALEQRPPASHYSSSRRRSRHELETPSYPLHDQVRRITASGHLNLGHRDRTVYLSTALAGEQVGLRESGGGRWRVSFLDLDLGDYDERTRSFQVLERSAPWSWTTSSTG